MKTAGEWNKTANELINIYSITFTALKHQTDIEYK